MSQLFQAAAARPATERSAFLAAACGDDEELRRDVESLLAHDASGTALLDHPATEAVAERRTAVAETGLHDLPAGAVFGGYRVERLLGRGGMGTVFLAYDATLRRHLALKVIDIAADGDASRRRLLREARAAAALNHPNICTIYEVGHADGRPFIAMEHVEGRSLRERIDEGALPVPEALHYAVQAADALAYAHDCGVVHRDLKAANVIVSGRQRLKIVDFGLARRTDAATAAATTLGSVRFPGVVAGTPYSMPPEQIRAEPVDARADIWAFGVLLFEMLTAATPFGADQSIPDLFSAILRDPPRPLPATVPPAVGAVIDRCLEKDPARRFQTAYELRDALKPVVSELGDAGGARRTRRLRWTGAAAVGTLAVLAAVLAPGRLTRSPSEPVPSEVRSLAVLPLEDLSQDPGQAYFSDGMTDELITKIARIPQLRVVPRSAVMKYRAEGRAAPDISRELGVDAILDGSVLRIGNRVRISTHLIDPQTNRELWAESFERELGDVLVLQSEIALAVAGRIRSTLTPSDRTRLTVQDRSVNPAAYDDYLRGLAHIERVSRDDSGAAVRVLERAVALAPDFADAWAALAVAYSQLYGSYAPAEADPLEAKAQAAIDQAFALDRESADAHFARGTLIWNAAHGWPHEQSASAYRAALAAKPTLEPARRALAVVYNHVGLPDAALRALADSSDSPAVLFQKGLASFIRGDTERAASLWLTIPPASRNASHIGHIAWALQDLRRPDEAWSTLEQARSDGIADVNGMLAAARAVLHAAAGERQQAERWIATATARAADTTESHHATYLAAVAYARLGRPDESLRWLRLTASNGFPCYPLFANRRELDPLRSYAPFSEFVAESKVRWDGYRVRLGG